jgi:hypothetical protein
MKTKTGMGAIWRRRYFAALYISNPVAISTDIRQEPLAMEMKHVP